MQLHKKKRGVKNRWKLVSLRVGGIRRHLIAIAIKKILYFLSPSPRDWPGQNLLFLWCLCTLKRFHIWTISYSVNRDFLGNKDFQDWVLDHLQVFTWYSFFILCWNRETALECIVGKKRLKNSTDRKLMRRNSTQAIIRNLLRNTIRKHVDHLFRLQGIDSSISYVNFHIKMQKKQYLHVHCPVAKNSTDVSVPSARFSNYAWMFHKSPFSACRTLHLWVHPLHRPLGMWW